MENTDPIEFRFTGIQILSKNLEKIPEKGVGTEFQFDLKAEIKVTAELKLVMPIVSVAIRQKQEKLASITIACIFEIPDFDNRIIKNEHNVYIIPPQLDQIIRPVAISTCRGVMYSEFRGTHVSGAILPVVFMNQLKMLPKEEQGESYTIAKDAIRNTINL